jgi:hypothetical protein
VPLRFRPFPQCRPRRPRPSPCCHPRRPIRRRPRHPKRCCRRDHLTRPHPRSQRHPMSQRYPRRRRDRRFRRIHFGHPNPRSRRHHSSPPRSRSPTSTIPDRAFSSKEPTCARRMPAQPRSRGFSPPCGLALGGSKSTAVDPWTPLQVAGIGDKSAGRRLRPTPRYRSRAAHLTRSTGKTMEVGT